MTDLSHLFWKILSEYISNKDKEVAAHHLVSELIDAGVEEDDLWDACKGNPILAKVVKAEIGEDMELEEDE